MIPVMWQETVTSWSTIRLDGYTSSEDEGTGVADAGPASRAANMPIATTIFMSVLGLLRWYLISTNADPTRHRAAGSPEGGVPREFQLDPEGAVGRAAPGGLPDDEAPPQRRELGAPDFPLLHGARSRDDRMLRSRRRPRFAGGARSRPDQGVEGHPRRGQPGPRRNAGRGRLEVGYPLRLKISSPVNNRQSSILSIT